MNDDRHDPAAPVIPEMEILLMWDGPDRGLVCPPTVGEYCDLGFYDGDSNSPYIGNFRPNGKAPEAELDFLMIQHSPGIRIGFKPDSTTVIVKAPLIELKGRVEVTGGIYQKAGPAATAWPLTARLILKTAGFMPRKMLSPTVMLRPTATWPQPAELKMLVATPAIIVIGAAAPLYSAADLLPALV